MNSRITTLTYDQFRNADGLVETIILDFDPNDALYGMIQFFVDERDPAGLLDAPVTHVHFNCTREQARELWSFVRTLGVQFVAKIRTVSFTNPPCLTCETPRRDDSEFCQDDCVSVWLTTGHQTEMFPSVVR